MIKLAQNAQSYMIVARCHNAGCLKVNTITTVTRYHCQWCSRPIPNFRLLVNFQDERVKYHFKGKVYNVTM